MYDGEFLMENSKAVEGDKKCIERLHWIVAKKTPSIDPLMTNFLF